MERVLVLAGRLDPDGGPCRSTLALLTLARRLGSPTVLLCGAPGPTSVAPGPGCVATLGAYGARAVWTAEVSEMDEYPATARVEALVRLAERLDPACVLVAGGPMGCEIAGRVAVRLESGVLTGVVDVRTGPGGPVAVQRVLGGTQLVESGVVRGVMVCTVCTEAVDPEPAQPEPAQSEPAQPEPAQSEPAQPEPAQSEPLVRRLDLVFPQGLRAARVVSREPRDGATLASAAVVVAGGRGIGSRDGFDLVRRVADALGGAACGSHTATELGFSPPHRRVDQIGTAVHPSLYLALGVSGSVRHRAGMQGARTIVAIDRDPQAPIFGIADLAIVGDVHEVGRQLLAEIQRRRK